MKETSVKNAEEKNSPFVASCCIEQTVEKGGIGQTGQKMSSKSKMQEGRLGEVTHESVVKNGHSILVGVVNDRHHVLGGVFLGKIESESFQKSIHRWFSFE